VDILTLEDETTTLSENMRYQTPNDTAQHPRIMETSKLGCQTMSENTRNMKVEGEIKDIVI
jgi:hypothetical protein